MTPPERSPLPPALARTVDELRGHVRAARREGRTIGFVPTMGALHDGHLALVRAARAANDLVVVSLFVNPSQFNDSRDLERYPRDERSDVALLAETGADVLFAPGVDEIYPEGFATSVRVAGLDERFEGEVRGPEHFGGVATVVTKLLCIAQPDEAYFGRKDAQQLHLIRRLAADLNLPVKIVGVDTVREPGGLALSSRNALLDADERRRAAGLPAAIAAAREAVAAGERTAPTVREAARSALVAHGARPEYVAIVDEPTFTELDVLSGDVLLLIAARVGEVRLIDNEVLRCSATRTANVSGEAATAA